MPESDPTLEALRRGNNAAFEALYRRYYSPIAAYVRLNSGADSDARDLFQEALVVLVKKVREADFQLTADVGAYFTAVAKKLWLYRLRSRKIYETSDTSETGTDDPEFPTNEMKASAREQAVLELLEHAKTDCRGLLEGYYFKKLSLSELAEIGGYTSSFVKIKKQRCLEELRKRALSHPAFHYE